MKTTLKITSLFALAGISVAAAAESAGLPLPSFVTAEAAISLFVAALALLTFMHDYVHPRPLPVSAPRPGRFLPAGEAFSGARTGVPVRRQPRQRRTFKPTVSL